MAKMNSINIEIYGDIIKLPHHESNTRPQMSKAARAAQFAPFAALTASCYNGDVHFCNKCVPFCNTEKLDRVLKNSVQ